MRRLAELAPPGAITPLIFLDLAEFLLAMEAVPQPHENWKTRLLAGQVDLAHVRQFAELLAALHGQGAQRREQFANEFDDRNFFESLRLEPYYLYTARQVPAASNFLENLVARTRATRNTLVHGDYSPKNVLIHNDRLILLDHEVIHFGDGAFDVGFSLTHLLSKAHHLASVRPLFAKAAAHYWTVYNDEMRSQSARVDEQAVVAHTLGCLLARCRGRSPLEYLTDAERDRQADAVVTMMTRPPRTVGELIHEFLSKL